MGKKFVSKMYKIHKNVKNCKKSKRLVIQVFHIKTDEKGGKSDVFLILSTLST